MAEAVYLVAMVVCGLIVVAAGLGIIYLVGRVADRYMDPEGYMLNPPGMKFLAGVVVLSVTTFIVILSGLVGRGIFQLLGLV